MIRLKFPQILGMHLKIGNQTIIQQWAHNNQSHFLVTMHFKWLILTYSFFSPCNIMSPRYDYFHENSPHCEYPFKANSLFRNNDETQIKNNYNSWNAFTHNKQSSCSRSQEKKTIIIIATTPISIFKFDSGCWKTHLIFLGAKMIVFFFQLNNTIKSSRSTSPSKLPVVFFCVDLSELGENYSKRYYFWAMYGMMIAT